MRTLTIPQFKDFIRHVACRLDQPVFGWSQPGVGKTQAVAQVSKEDGMQHAVLHLGQYDTVDLRGTPSRVAGQTVWSPPATLPFVGMDGWATDRPILLHLDEMNGAQQSVQGAAYQLVNERRLGEHVLMPNVRIVASGNREGDKGVVTRQPLPLANRMTHVTIEVNVPSFIAYAEQIGLPDECVGFYTFRPDLLNTFDPTKADKAFATPRSSEVAWRYIADQQMPDVIKDAAICGAVGDGVATEITAFLAVWKDVAGLLPKIIKSPMTVDVPKKPDMQYALTTYLVSVLVETVKTKGVKSAPVENVAAFIDRLPGDFAPMFWAMATRRCVALVETKPYVAFASKMAKLITER